MLRIEAYPVMDGLRVNFIGTDPSESPDHTGNFPKKIEQVIPTETIEEVGVTEALREVLFDVLYRHPGIVHLALH